MTLEELKANSFVDANNCWLWLGASSAGSTYNRYGSVVSEGVTKLVHRLAWELSHGEVPAHLVVAHSCNKKKCCNPAHLELLTCGENIKAAWRDGLAKVNRTANARLTTRKIDLLRAMRRASKADVSDRQLVILLAPLFGTSSATLRAVLSGTTWGWYVSKLP